MADLFPEDLYRKPENVDPDFRVLHLTTLQKGGGTEHFVSAICDAVPQFEWLSLEELGAWPFGIRSKTILKDYFSGSKHSVIYAYGINAQISAWISAPSNIPIIGVIHGEIDFEGIKDSIRRQYQRRIDCWVGNTAAVLDRKGYVIYNGILTLEKLELVDRNIKNRYDFGVLANGGAVKGHRFLIELWRHYQKSRQNPPGSLAFAGNLPDDLKRDAEAAGIICPGYCDRVEFLSGIGMLLIPSVSESFPTVIAESISLGIPVLANPAGGIAEVLGPLCPEAVVPRAHWPEILANPELESRSASARKVCSEIRELFDFGRSCDAFLGLACNVFENKSQ